MARAAVWRQILEVGAVCASSASTDLRRGWRVTAIPTVTLFLWASIHAFNPLVPLGCIGFVPYKANQPSTVT